jgi:hypothetical protein
MNASLKNATMLLKAFKRAPCLGLSRWYMGILTTDLVEKKDSNGEFLSRGGNTGARDRTASACALA